MKKVTSFFKALTFTDFLRKVIFYLFSRKDYHLLRKVKSIFYFKSTNVILGKSVTIIGLAFKISVGEMLRIYDKSIFEFGPKAVISFGNNNVLSYGVVFSCREEIKLGDDVQIGEYTSIRDTTHNYNCFDVSMRIAGDISNPISIGNNVWIGRGCIILPGSIIEDGVVVGANSVVKGKLISNGIYTGAPARLIKMRATSVIIS